MKYLSLPILIVSFVAGAGDTNSNRTANAALNGLPGSPGAHHEKIKALGDNAWLNIGSPTPDPKWGKARGRAWGARMPYAPELKAAFLFGEGQHGWFNKDNNKYMDDLWAYDANGHRWICIYPGADLKTLSVKMGADGFEVDSEGQPLPVAQMVHGYEMVTYDTDRRKFMFMPCPGSYWLASIGERRKEGGGCYPNWPFIPTQCSPWMYDVAAGKFEISKTKGACPGSGFADVLVYVPSIKKSFCWRGGAKDAWFYDPQTNAWTNVAPKGPPPPFGIDANACLDTKRERIYIGGGYYPVSAGPHAFWCYDIKTNAWVDLEPKGKPCGGCNRYGPNKAAMNYDSASDAVVLFYHLLPVAETDGPINPGPEALGIYVYDPTANTWNEKPLPLARELGQSKFTLCYSSFYSAELNAHFIHAGGDSDDNMFTCVYRYKQAKK